MRVNWLGIIGVTLTVVGCLGMLSQGSGVHESTFIVVAGALLVVAALVLQFSGVGFRKVRPNWAVALVALVFVVVRVIYG